MARRCGRRIGGAIPEIQACRTEALGRGLWRCDQCDAEVFSYRSCKNRSCPKCHTDPTERWLAARKAEMLFRVPGYSELSGTYRLIFF